MAALEGCDYYLILNSDAVLRPGFLAALAAAVAQAPEAGLIAPRIETEEGEVQVSCFRFASPDKRVPARHPERPRSPGCSGIGWCR